MRHRPSHVISKKRPRFRVLSPLLLLGLQLAAISGGCSSEPPPNVVIILIDTLRADHLSSYGYHRETSPHIDRLAEEGTLFQRAYSASAYTKASTASLLTGLYPSVHGAIEQPGGTLANNALTLAEVLQTAGYQTIGWVRNPTVAAELGFGRGFDTFESPRDAYLRRSGLDPADNQSPEISRNDASITAEVIPFLEEIGEAPFFLYLHMVDPHVPYAPPRDGRSFLDSPLTPVGERFYEDLELIEEEGRAATLPSIRFGRIPVDEETLREMIALYDGEIAFSDLQVGAIVEALRVNGHLENTLLIVTADHGEEFMDHGTFGHGFTHYDEQLHVPLVVRGPGVGRGIHPSPVSLIDVMPTVLELTGLETATELPGRRLGAILENPSAGSEQVSIVAEGIPRFLGEDPAFFRSIQRGGDKLILDFQRHRKLLFDLYEDPAETTNLLSARQDLGRDLLAEMIRIHNGHLDEFNAYQPASNDIPEHVLSGIRALGYVGSGAEKDLLDHLRQPMRLLDLDPAGFMGNETNFSAYVPAVNFREGDFAEEQLLYGWQTTAGDPARMVRRAGLILKRDGNETDWELTGLLRFPDGTGRPLELTVRVDDGVPHKQTFAEAGRIVMSGSLEQGTSDFVRLDIECGKDFFSGRPRNDEYARCLSVLAVRLQ